MIVAATAAEELHALRAAACLAVRLSDLCLVACGCRASDTAAVYWSSASAAHGGCAELFDGGQRFCCFVCRSDGHFGLTNRCSCRDRASGDACGTHRGGAPLSKENVDTDDGRAFSAGWALY